MYTSSGFLPSELRPSEDVYLSYFGATDNGSNLSYSFATDPTAIPPPAAGYLIGISRAGALVIQGIGSVGNIIPAGPQVLLPTTINYILEETPKLKKNVQISTGATNITQFTGNAFLGYFRDLHTNDAYDNVVAFAWTDNSMEADKTNGVLNAMVAVGTVDKHGNLRMNAPIQLTNYSANVLAWDTSVAINRKNTNNIIVSWILLDYNGSPSSSLWQAISFDGGKTWPVNGLINTQPTGNPSWAFDSPGVASDQFGNIWYVSTNGYTATGEAFDTPYFAVSTDEGQTYQVIFTLPEPTDPLIFGYDYPIYTFGNDASGQYGLYYTVDFFGSETNGDGNPVVGFIPINGFNSFGTPTTPISLTSFVNSDLTNIPAASSDGRFWLYGAPNGIGSGIEDSFGTTGITSKRLLYKSPGPIDQNYAGPWDVVISNLLNVTLNFPLFDSTGPDGYFGAPRNIVFDNARQALYVAEQINTPDFSQNMRLILKISRDNGQTWSNGMMIAETKSGNRGFQSMALDPKTGNLVFGWYDGRHDPSYQSVEYYGAVVPAKILDKLVNAIPLSDPTYTLPSAGIPFSPP